MKILILGGTGAMGVPLTELLAEAGHEVYVTSRNTHQDSKGIHYIQGNAKDDGFLRSVTQALHYDAIVDFMHYQPEMFRERMNLLLSSTEHYLFLSSCRAFAPSDIPIVESSLRLLDSKTDKEFLATNEYALAKARNENLLRESGYNNHTIIRPYITYNTERLQLGMFEKEVWLYRALKGRSIVFGKDMMEKKTTLTYARDVANAMKMIIERRFALGHAVNLVTDGTVTWGQVLEKYVSVIEKITGRRPNVVMLENSKDIGALLGMPYKLKYDRLSDRIFDNDLVKHLTDNMQFVKPLDGLEKCLTAFIHGYGRTTGFRHINWRMEAYLDKMTGERTPLKEIPTIKTEVKYFMNRYTSLHHR